MKILSAVLFGALSLIAISVFAPAQVSPPSAASFANPNFTGTVSMEGINFLTHNGNYNDIYEPVGNIAIAIGNASDPSTYYGNTGHVFRNRTGSATYLTITNTGMAYTGLTFVSLGAPANGTQQYCTDCNSTCTAGGGTGRMCFRENGAWAH